MSGFDDPEAVARYAEGPRRLVPGLDDLHRMARLLLDETVPPDGHVLVVGAGGGMELRAFAEARAGWRFTGVDPSAGMLKLAARTLGPMADRADLREGYVADAPDGPFDGAACLLTLHFVPEPERIATLSEIRRRLKPGAALILAHHSLPDGPARAVWLNRFAAFATDNGLDPDRAHANAHAIGEALPLQTPDTEVAHLRAARFTDVQLFYAAFTFRGWVARG